MGLLMQRFLARLGKWTRQSIPDLSGKLAVVTGFNSGIGMEVCRALLEHGAEVIGVSRNPDLGELVLADLQEEFPKGKVSFKVCNLETMSEVTALAQDLLASGRHISILINNAGRYLDAPFAVTKEGLNHTLAVDYFAPVLLTALLLENVIANGPARIINVVSPAEMFGTLDWSDLRGTLIGTSGMPAYGRAKLQLLMHSYELQRRLRLAGTQVDCFPVHPGIVSTALFNKVDFRYPLSVWTYVINLLQGQTPVQGAQSTLYAATAPSLAGKGGRYIGPQYTSNLLHASWRSPVNRAAHDPDAWQRLWEETCALLGSITGRAVPSLPAVGTRV